MKLAPLIALAASVALACSPANVGSPADAGGNLVPDGGPTAAQACKDYGYAYCDQLKACSTTALAYRFGDIQTCKAMYTTQCTNAASAPSTGSGPATAESCANAIAGWACPDFLLAQNIPPGCNEAVGLLQNGAPCGVRQQCASGYCGYRPGSACGTCAPPPKPGDSCVETECPQGLLCAAAGTTCVAYAQKGEACGATQPCNDGLTCVTTASGAICQTGGTAGAPCSPGAGSCDFYAGFSCNAATGMCTTAPLVAPGHACGIVANQGTSCIAGTCPRGVCVGNVPVGGACDPHGEASCIAFSRCITSVDGGTSGTCQLNGSSSCP